MGHISYLIIFAKLLNETESTLNNGTIFFLQLLNSRIKLFLHHRIIIFLFFPHSKT